MVWEMLYCVMFFVVPIVGMLTAIGVRSFKGEQMVLDEIEEDVNGLVDLGVAVGGLLRGSRYYEGMRPHEDLTQGALIIDLDAYRKMKIIKVMKGQVYSRDGPGDTS